MFITVFTSVNLILLFVFSLRTKTTSPSIKAFRAVLMTFLLWSIANYFSIHSPTEEEITFWIRAVMSVTSAMTYAIFLFINVFPDNVPFYSRRVSAGIAITSIIVGVISLFTPLLISEAKVVNGSIQPTFNIGIIIFAANAAVVVGSLVVAIRNKFKQLNNIQKDQMRLVFQGLLLTVAFALITNLALVVISRNSSFVEFGPAFSLIFIYATFLAVIRYRLFNIRILIGRILYYTLTGVIPYATFFVLVAVYGQLSESYFTPEIFLVTAFLAAVGVYVFNYLNAVIRKQVTLRFINPGYDPLEVVNDLSNELSLTLEFQQILDTVEKNLKLTLRPSFINIYRFDKGNLALANNENAILKNALNLFWSVKGKAPFIVDVELIDANATNSGNLSNLELDITRILVSLSARAVLPLTTSDKTLGVILLGQKEADTAYSQQDADFLKSVATAASVAIERSLLYTEVQEFANSLQKKVDAATKELTDTNIELETSLSEIQEARRKERDMMDVMGHELRTPLTIVRNALAMLDRERVKNSGQVAPEKLEDYLHKGLEAARREITLVETLLSATKVDASRLQLNLEQVSAAKLIEAGIEGQKSVIEDKGLQVEYTPLSPDLFMYADAVRTHEIVDNFISNAAKYTPQGKIYINAWQAEGKVWMEVRDTGMGIDEPDLQNLGKKFFRAKQHIKGKDVVRPGGTGLGLYVTFELIRIQSGELYINSQVGVGTSFTFGLPAYNNQQSNQYDQTFDAGQLENRQHIFLNRQPPQPQAGL